jgi:Cu/Ag efflux protein CusF
VNRKLILAILALVLWACGRKPETGAAEKHYALLGRVVALNAQDRTATVDAAAIPNFMEAMTMPYPVKSKAEFEKLYVGEKIAATVNVSGDGLYDLSNIRSQSTGK